MNALLGLFSTSFASVSKTSFRTTRLMSSKKMTQKDFVKHTELKQIRDTELVSKELFVDSKKKNKDTYMGALDLFKNGDIRRRGSVEFINAALKHMKEFGVERDLEVYKSLMDVMPKNVYVPQSRIQAGFFHYPRQQDCLLGVLTQMSENKVTPDRETGELILSITGLDSSPYRKFARMRYWDSKFKNMSPFPLPDPMPDDSLTLAQMAIEQITCVDRLTEIKLYDTENLVPEHAEDKTWIVSGISPKQKDLINNYARNSTLYVEGAFRVWLKKNQVTYFVLKGASRPTRPKYDQTQDVGDVTKIKVWTHGDSGSEYSHLPEACIHEQSDSTILACCATGTSSKDSLLSWIRFLEREVPHLCNLQILFTLKQLWSPIKPLTQEELNMQPYNKTGS